VGGGATRRPGPVDEKRLEEGLDAMNRPPALNGSEDEDRPIGRRSRFAAEPAVETAQERLNRAAFR
jgi:hypothetical protein